MARNKTQLLNFRQPKRSARTSSDTTGTDGTFTDAQQVAYFKNVYMKTVGGSFRNAEDVRGYVEFLKSLDQTPEIQIETAKMENEAMSYDNDQKAIYSSVSKMKDLLTDSLRTAMSESGGDLNQLLSSQALIYSEFLDKADSFAAETLKNYKSNTQLGDDYYKFKDELEKKSMDLTSLSVQLNDPKLVGSFDPETVSLQITTNPSTGVISDIKFVPRGAVDKGYVDTDIKMKVREGVPAVPVAINAIDNGSTADGTQKRMGRLGDMKLFGTFKKSAQDDKEITGEYGFYQLKAQDSAGWTPFSRTPVETGRKEGFNLNSFKTDGDDVGTGSIVRRGTRLFYTTQDGSLQEFSGDSYSEKVTSARAFLVNIGDTDPDKVFYPKPISEQFISRPDPVNGKASRVLTPIGPQSFAGSNPMAVPVTDAPVPMSSEENMSRETFFGGSSQEPQMSVEKPMSMGEQSAPGFFANRVNRQNKPDAPKESEGKKTFIGDVIDKGKSFFRSIG